MAATWELREGRITFRGDSASLSVASETLPAGAYTTLRTYRGDRIVRLGQHVQRLVDSLRIQGQAASLDEGDVRRLVAAALTARLESPARVPGDSRLRLTFSPPSLFVTVEPLEPLAESIYRDGVWCVTVPIRRDHPAAKDTRFIATASAAYQALPEGAHEGLMVADDGSILEGLSSNFFAILDGVLRTEEARALHGVTRSLVLELARGVVPVSLTAVPSSELPRVSECFLTSVSREILPVARVDDVTMGADGPGRITRTLIERFAGLVEREARTVS